MNVAMKDNTQEFIEKASLVSARVYRVKDLASALDKSLELCRSKLPCQSQMETDQTASDAMSGEKLRIMAAPNLDEADFIKLDKACRESGDIRLIRENLRAYPGGIDIGGGLWRRGTDNIGIGYAFFDGGNTGLQSVQVSEAYYRLAMNDLFALTADIQYQDNQYENAGAGTDIDALTLGLRAVVEF
jgi:hypothetical protein